MPELEPPVLIGCAHGTRAPAGRRALAELRLQIAGRRPGLTVLAASVDVQKPELDAVVSRLTAAGRRCVIVPLLLSAGYHVAVDVARAVAGSAGLAVAAGALGPDRALVEVLLDRLTECGATPADDVVLAAAGSSDPRAVADVAAVAAALQACRGGSVTAAYLSAARPTVDEAVAAVRCRPVRGRVLGAAPGLSVATYLLAPGFFADRLAGCGADRVSRPLAPHPLLAELALRRYDEAIAAG